MTDTSPEAVGRLWPIGGFAPGGYMCQCSRCKETFLGDKRAFVCPICTTRALAAKLEFAEAALATAREEVMTATYIVIKDERWPPQPLWRSFAGQACFVTVLFGPGLLFDNTPMQWAGFAVFLAVIFIAFVRTALEWKSMTIAAARARLDELEARP